MPLSLFNHNNLAHYREIRDASRPYEHWFGGRLSDFGIRYVKQVDAPLQLLYCLDLTDPLVPVELPGLTRLPLLYGFRCMDYDATFIYRPLNDIEIELIAPTRLSDDPDCPYPRYPRYFPASKISFRREPYDPTIAEDALALQGVFGLDRLPASEMARAIQIAFSKKRHDGSVYDIAHVERPADSDFTDWSDEQYLRHFGTAPFIQSPPSKSCDNPGCTAEIIDSVDEMEIDLADGAPSDLATEQARWLGIDDLNAAVAEYFGTTKFKVGGHHVRADSMRVIAIHQPDTDERLQPDTDERLIWGDNPYNQLVFEICEACHCIRASHQCT